MGKTAFLDTRQMVLVSTNSSGVLGHGMILKVSNRNLGDPFTVVLRENGGVNSFPNLKTASNKLENSKGEVKAGMEVRTARSRVKFG